MLKKFIVLTSTFFSVNSELCAASADRAAPSTLDYLGGVSAGSSLKSLPLSFDLLPAGRGTVSSFKRPGSSVPLAFSISREPYSSATAVLLMQFQAPATLERHDSHALSSGSAAPDVADLLAPCPGTAVSWRSISDKENANRSWATGPGYGIYTDSEYAEVMDGTRAENAAFDKLISRSGKTDVPETLDAMALPFLKNSKVGRKLVLGDVLKHNPKHDASAWVAYLQACYKHNPDAFYRNLNAICMDWRMYRRVKSFLGDTGLRAFMLGLKNFYLERETLARDTRLLITDKEKQVRTDTEE